ncbi:MAG: RedB protein [Rhodopirellula sp.]|nr:RedB protein [Rhodopirellula sp.]
MQLFLKFATVLWGAATVTGLLVVWNYSATPVEGHSVGPNWPEQVCISRSLSRPTLVMCLHPRCSCSRASLHELERILAHAGDRVQTHILVFKPAEASDDWVQSDTYRTARRIVGDNVAIDAGGFCSASFGATASGHVVLYSSSGQRLFAGGITISRGHEGDNPGRSAIQALLRGDVTETDCTPVFGCPIRSS